MYRYRTSSLTGFRGKSLRTQLSAFKRIDPFCVYVQQDVVLPGARMEQMRCPERICGQRMAAPHVGTTPICGPTGSICHYTRGNANVGSQHCNQPRRVAP